MTKVRREIHTSSKEAEPGNGIRPPGTRRENRQEPSPVASRLSPHLAEVIEADTVQFMAECRQLYAAPDFGSFIRVDSASLMGVAGSSPTRARTRARMAEPIEHEHEHEDSLTPDPRPLTATLEPRSSTATRAG
jgi:hypothetical protein